MRYVPKKQAEYGHQPFVMSENEVHGQVDQLQPGALWVRQQMAKREQKGGNILGTVPQTLYRGRKHNIH